MTFKGGINDNFQLNVWTIFIFLLTEAVLTRTHNLFLEQKKENNVYPCKPQSYYIKVGCKGVLLQGHVIIMCYSVLKSD